MRSSECPVVFSRITLNSNSWGWVSVKFRNMVGLMTRVLASEGIQEFSGGSRKDEAWSLSLLWVPYRQWLKWWVAGGAQPHLPWLGLPLLWFEPILVKNCHAQHECKIIEVDCQNDRWVACCKAKIGYFWNPKIRINIFSWAILGELTALPTSPSLGPLCLGLWPLLERALSPVNAYRFNHCFQCLMVGWPVNMLQLCLKILICAVWQKECWLNEYWYVRAIRTGSTP